MLDTVVASRFVKRLTTGRNTPLLLEAERQDGSFVEVVAKFDGAECGKGGLVREAVAGMLAADLGLPIPECFVVEIPAGFHDTIPTREVEARKLVKASGSRIFGSAFHEGWYILPVGYSIPSETTAEAAEVLAFDGICLNGDRRPEKPNCLHKGSQIMMIDHEMALNHYGIGTILNPFPWKLGSLTPFSSPPTEHVFYKGTKGKALPEERLESQFGVVTQVKIANYLAAVPADWDPSGDVGLGIGDYLAQALINMGNSFTEVRRLLA
jgi:hypothetical protein